MHPLLNCHQEEREMPEVPPPASLGIRIQWIYGNTWPEGKDLLILRLVTASKLSYMDLLWASGESETQIVPNTEKYPSQPSFSTAPCCSKVREVGLQNKSATSSLVDSPYLIWLHPKLLKRYHWLKGFFWSSTVPDLVSWEVGFGFFLVYLK